MPHDNTAILKITDGTESVDLLHIREGVSIEAWRQAVAQYRAGGTFQESSLADGRRLVDTKFTAIREAMPIKIGQGGTRGNQNASILMLQKMFALFQKAAAYWTTTWQCEPVWLEKRASCETNIEYGHVVTATIPELDDIYQTGFDTGAMTGMTLIIERGHWLENAPGTGTATELSAVETWNSVDLGNVDSSGDREPATSGVYIQNMRVPANITHAFTWSAANGFSGNLVGGGVPFDLVDVAGAAPAVNDYVAFGVDISIQPDSSMRSLVFDIGTAQTGISLTWEIYSSVGPGWVAMSVQDNTATAQPFDTAGINSVHWYLTTQANSTINGVNAWWVRARVTAVPGPVVAPVQQNRDVYSITWPYTEIQADEVNGDLPALTRIKLAVQSHNDGGVGGIDDLYFNRFVAGLRSMSRGTNFTAILNTDNRVGINPTGITTAPASGGNQFAAADAAIEMNVAGVSAMADRAVFTFDTSISPEYYGTFRAFVRFRPVTGSANIVTQLRVKLGAGGETITNPENVTWSTFDYIIVDYGKVDIPGQDILDCGDSITLEIAVQIETTGAAQVGILDMIMIPVDEWAIDTQDVVNDADSTIEEGRYLDIDSVVYPKRTLRSLARETSDDEVTGTYLAIKNGPAIVQHNSRQRLWCFMMRSETAGSSTWIGNIQTAATIQIERNQRYLGPRGNQ